MRQTFPISGKLANPQPKPPKYDFPWETVEIGHGFAVSKDEVKLITLRSMCSHKSKLLKKKFRVAIHDDCYEVGRLA